MPERTNFLIQGLPLKIGNGQLNLNTQQEKPHNTTVQLKLALQLKCKVSKSVVLQCKFWLNNAPKTGKECLSLANKIAI